MKWRVAAGAGLLLLVAPAGPASAQGLFDLLMGGAAPTVAGTPAESGTLTVHRRHTRPHPAVPRAARMQLKTAEAGHRPAVAIDPAEVADWYLRDRTLRRGDIVVLRSGALVYTGRRAGDVRPADFARLRDARFLPARTRDFVARATADNAHAATVVAPPKPRARPSAT